MIYEIIAVVYILWTILLFAVNPGKKFIEKYGGKKWKEQGEDKEFTIAAVGLLITSLFSIIVTVLFMFWTVAKGVVIAKYYAFALIIYVVFTIAMQKSDNKVIPKKIELKAKVFRYVTTFSELSIVLYTLWVLVG